MAVGYIGRLYSAIYAETKLPTWQRGCNSDNTFDRQYKIDSKSVSLQKSAPFHVRSFSSLRVQP